MSKKSEEQEENKKYTEDCELDISLRNYRVKICLIKNNFLERKYGLEILQPETETFLLN
jgi:hypothetical protein